MGRSFAVQVESRVDVEVEVVGEGGAYGPVSALSNYIYYYMEFRVVWRAELGSASLPSYNPKFTLVADGDGGRRPCRLHLRLKCCIKISIGGREAEGRARPPILF